ncbi:MAG: 2-amino-4-hydroxy-6-hydroxymethyldihydropteridine diphosphokinase [Anaerolineae bacterium]|nr:2-amino-4-hydroxy-6-hydroxymethyldihydropteridine diphosphokinase [Anaerolineae bacterium]
MPHVYLSLGSNHNAADNLREGLRLIAAVAEVRAVSTVYESPAVGEAGGAPYLNAAILIDTDLPREELKAQLKQIEAACGRVRRDAEGRKSSVVSLDLDITLYGDQPPHTDLARYAHVAVPLAEIAPDLIPPGESKPLRTLAQRFAESSLIARNDIELMPPAPPTF